MEVQEEVRAALVRWRTALLSNDRESFVNLYAPVVSPYFTKSRVTRAQVLDEVRRTEARYGPTTLCKVSEVNIDPVDENHATVRFRKQWRNARNTFAGEEKSSWALNALARNGRSRRRRN